MPVHFANSYIDRLFAERDLEAIYHLTSVVIKERSLPEEFWLFCRIYEWAPSRSGVWQYYEGLQDSKFNQVSEALDRFRLQKILERYREGKMSWNSSTRAIDLDHWLETHAPDIHGQIFDLIESRKDCLRNQSERPKESDDR